MYHALSLSIALTTVLSVEFIVLINTRVTLSQSSEKVSLNEVLNSTETSSVTDHESPLCNLTVNSQDAIWFVRQALLRGANIAYLHLIIPNASVTVEDDVFLPGMWVWTYTSMSGAFPYLRFDYAAGRLSFGLLEFHTLRGVNLTMDVDQQNCSLRFGDKSTTRQIAQSLTNMLLQYYPPNGSRNYSVFCYIHKVDVYRQNKPWFYVITYLGIWQDFTAYKCCFLQRNPSSDTFYPNCTDNLEKLSDWSTLFFVISLTSFLYLPMLLAIIGGYFGSGWAAKSAHRRGLSSDSQEDLNNSKFNEEMVLLEDNLTWGDIQPGEDADNSKWLFLDIDTPVCVLSVFKLPYRYLETKFPLFASRLRRLFLFGVVVPLPVYIKIIYYRLTASLAITSRLKADIPVGFVSIPYGFWASVQNWLTIFGGPYVVIGVYLTLGQIFVCAPRDLIRFFRSVLKSEEDFKQSVLDISLIKIEKFGAVQLRTVTGHLFLQNLFKGNLYTVINPDFWKSVIGFFIERYTRRSKFKTNICLYDIILIFVYSVICFAESVCCFLYLCFPVVFCFANLTRAVLAHLRKMQWGCLMIPVTTIAMLFIYYAFYLIFIRGSFFVILVVNFVYAATIIYPDINLGFIIGISAMVMYVGLSLQKLRDTYLCIMHDLVAINLNLEKNSKMGDSVRIEDKIIVLTKLSVDPKAVTKLSYNGVTIVLTREQRNLLRQVHSVIGSVHNPSQSRYIRWRGCHPGIPSRLFYHVIEKHQPLRGAIFNYVVKLLAFTLLVVSMTNLIIDFQRASRFTLPAQVVTAIVLTLLPKITELMTSQLERQVDGEIMKRELEVTVKEFYSNVESAGSNTHC